jgi:hypothetical protein
MAITQENIFIGSYYRTQFGEVREVTGIVGKNVVYTPHRRTAASIVAMPSQDISLIRFAHDAQKEVERPQ